MSRILRVAFQRRTLQSVAATPQTPLQLLKAGIPPEVIIRLVQAEKESEKLQERAEKEAQRAETEAQRVEVQRAEKEVQAQRADFAVKDLKVMELELAFVKGKLLSRYIIGNLYN